MQCGAYACARVCVGVFVLLQIYLVYLNKRYRNVNWRAHQTMNKNSNNNKNNNHNRCICWQRRVQRCCRKPLLGVMLQGLPKKKNINTNNICKRQQLRLRLLWLPLLPLSRSISMLFSATQHDTTRRDAYQTEPKLRTCRSINYYGISHTLAQHTHTHTHTPQE